MAVVGFDHHFWYYNLCTFSCCTHILNLKNCYCFCLKKKLMFLFFNSGSAMWVFSLKSQNVIRFINIKGRSRLLLITKCRERENMVNKA